ncbi:MAG: precorrin-4 C(11)-methyltransferase [Alicyclobacillaceae bacterium]|nr:precorrin-4 C(11)-methyltransferase [Alicyclobacillaceae bacterium]
MNGPAKGKVYFIGAGPGDPELITVKGKRLIEEADLILYTDSLVNPEVLRGAKPGARIEGSAGLTLEEIGERMITAARRGERVARVHTGDPSVFGAVLEQAALLERAGVDWEIVPGVSSAFAAAAVLGTELTVPELTQTVILTRAEGRTPVPEKEKLADLARHDCSLALFLSAGLIRRVTEALREAGWDEDVPVAAVYKATWPDQVVVRSTLGRIAEDMQTAGIRSHAVILAGRALDPELRRTGRFKSKLYDKTFAHRYRRAAKEATVPGGEEK